MERYSRSFPSVPIDARRVGLRIDLYLILSTLALLAVGLIALYSKSVWLDNKVTFTKQVTNIAIGIVPFAIFYSVHPKVWQKSARVIYFVNLGLLLLVEFMGKSVKGAARWVDLGPIQFQPSELAKLLIVLTLASFFASRQDELKRFSTFALSFIHVAVPMGLILKQPHLGATVVVLVAWLAITLVSQTPWRTLGLTVAGFAVLAGAVLTVPAVSQRLLHGYQQDRISGLRSKGDEQGRNWQTARAEIAFGVGGVFGTGFNRGEQKRLGFIPEQETDFIFSVVGEEGGLVGSSILLLLYAVFFYRIWLIMVQADDPYYRGVAGGLFAMLFFHAFVNMAMVLQIVPVVGLWLPFLSYGGTAVWLCMASVGLLLNIHRHARPILF